MNVNKANFMIVEEETTNVIKIVKDVQTKEKYVN